MYADLCMHMCVYAMYLCMYVCICVRIYVLYVCEVIDDFIFVSVPQMSSVVSLTYVHHHLLTVLACGLVISCLANFNTISYLVG